LVLALCGRGVVGLVHLGVLDVTACLNATKAACAAFVFGDVVYCPGAMPVGCM
jgi:hypothetical protein